LLDARTSQQPLGGRPENRRLVNQAPDFVLRMSENIDCFLPGWVSIFENCGILFGSVFGHDMFSRVKWTLVLKTNDRCQAAYSRGVRSGGMN
jgi:hypothetical protein